MKCFVALFLLLPVAGLSAESEFAQQSFQEFDQSMGRGWRALDDAGKHKEAAQLIDRYLAEAKKDIEPYRSILNFHAGQCYAYAGENEVAVARFQQAYQAEEPASYAPLAKQWNAYVRGTIAFLKGGKKDLEQSRNDVAAGPEGSMKETNVAVLDRLIRNLGKTYLEAYRGN